MPDMKQMISEVVAENGIRIEPGDPLFALVTMNRMVFEESAQMYYESQPTADRGIQGVDEESRSACREHAGREGEGFSGEDAGGSAGRYSDRRPEGKRIRTPGERGPPASGDYSLGLRWVSGCCGDFRLRGLVWTLSPLVGRPETFPHYQARRLATLLGSTMFPLRSPA